MMGIFVALVTLAVAVNGLVEDDICKGQMEGNFLRNPEDCSRYLSCAGDKIKETKACMDDLLWDTDKNDCRPPDAVTCDNKPTTKNDPCPAHAAEKYRRFPYPDNSRKYILCKYGVNKGYRRDVRVNGQTIRDQFYFNDCPKKGKYYVLYEKHPKFYFVCYSGFHLKTKEVTDDVKDKIIAPMDLPKNGYLNGNLLNDKMIDKKNGDKMNDNKMKDDKMKDDKMKDDKMKDDKMKDDKMKADKKNIVETIQTGDENKKDKKNDMKEDKKDDKQAKKDDAKAQKEAKKMDLDKKRDEKKKEMQAKKDAKNIPKGKKALELNETVEVTSKEQTNSDSTE